MPGEGPIAILAGSGRLPAELVGHLEQSGSRVRVLAFRGFADASLRRRADAVIDLLDIRGILAVLDAWRPAAVTLAGAVQRPGPSALLGAFSIIRNRDEVKRILATGDDRLLRGAVRLLEEHGHRVIGAHELAPELLVPRKLGAGAPQSPDDRVAIDVAISLLDALSAFDVGQAVAVAGHRVLAVEGPEGTDRMLRRVARIRRSFLRSRKEGGVLVKAAKRGQDLRVDMPTVGPRTVTEAARAGLSGIALGAGSTLILERDETVRVAESLGLFIISIPLPWSAADE
jgi:UDP-2,3-diacylglucosamine hydrolase